MNPQRSRTARLSRRRTTATSLTLMTYTTWRNDTTSTASSQSGSPYRGYSCMSEYEEECSSCVWCRIVLYVVLQVVKPVTRCSVQHHQVSVTTVCRGHLLAMWRAVWLSAPHSRDADGDSPIWLMLYLNLPYPVLMRFRRKCRVRSCPTGLFDGVWMNSLKWQLVVSHLVSQVPSAHERHWSVAWLALRRDGRVAVAFVLVCLFGQMFVRRPTIKVFTLLVSYRSPWL